MGCSGCGSKKNTNQKGITPGSFTKAAPKSLNTIELSGKRYQVVGKKVKQR
jgi:hypothetical protein